jgi:hypothetical protein
MMINPNSKLIRTLQLLDMLLQNRHKVVAKCRSADNSPVINFQMDGL